MGSRKSQGGRRELFLILMFGVVILLLMQPARLNFFTLLIIEAWFIGFAIMWRSTRARRLEIECEDCGIRFVPNPQLTGERICAHCQKRTYSPDQLRRENKKHLRTFLIAVGVFVVTLTALLAKPVALQLDVNYWVAALLVAVGACFGCLALVIVLVYAVQNRQRRQMQNPRFALARARSLAGEAGQLDVHGPVTVWSCEEHAPASYFLERMESVRQEFEARIREPIDPLPPLRIFVFSKRETLVNFHGQAHTNLWNLDALYSIGPKPCMTFSQEVMPFRIIESDRAIRLLFGLYFLESYKGFFPNAWLYQGVGNSLAGGGDDLARLNRRMLASLQNGTAFGVELFRYRASDLFRMLMGWSDHSKHTKFAQFTGQSWSILEYLWGDGAPAGNRDCFRAFLRAHSKKESIALAFEQHFSRSPARILQEWQQWVRARGVGSHQPAPTNVRDALVNRVVPIIANRNAKIMDRIQAIREMGRVGYPLGADTLVQLLRDSGEIPIEEIVWALEAISGLNYASDTKQWSKWWESLPADVRGEDDNMHAAEIERVDSLVPQRVSRSLDR